jgi:hypothetical protein
MNTKKSKRSVSLLIPAIGLWKSYAMSESGTNLVMYVY